MMIEKAYGEYFLVCDICGEESEECWSTFQDAVDGAEEIGWGKDFTYRDGWRDICPECQEDE